MIIFDSETGKYLRHAMLPAIGYANMGVIESKKLLILIAQGENSLYLVNYQTCRDMVKISDLVNPTMFANENLVFSNMQCLDLQPFKESQIQNYGESIDASALVFVTMDNGCVLTGLLKVEDQQKQRADGYFNCFWIPQHLFNADRS